jgi:hypothetical protein
LLSFFVVCVRAISTIKQFSQREADTVRVHEMAGLKAVEHCRSMNKIVYLLCLARLRFNRSVTTIPSPWRMGAGWRRWRLSWLIA